MRALVALTTAAAAFTPLHLTRSTQLSAGKGFGELDPSKVARVQVPLSERFTLVYTCNRCETRNAISVSRVA